MPAIRIHVSLLEFALDLSAGCDQVCALFRKLRLVSNGWCASSLCAPYFSAAFFFDGSAAGFIKVNRCRLSAAR
jgi:hypothetical protein